MRRSVIGIGLLTASAVVLGMGCGGGGESDGVAETAGSDVSTTSQEPARAQGDRSSVESRWIEDSRIEATLTAMRLDIRSFC